jgi:hypothetical protein
MKGKEYTKMKIPFIPAVEPVKTYKLYKAGMKKPWQT